MARSINKVILIGNVGRDPDVQTTQSGKKVARLSLATSRRTTYQNGAGERTEWHRLTLWDKLAQLAEEYIRKGDRLFVEGRIEYGSYERTDGETAYTTDIVVNELIMLGAPGGASADDEQVPDIVDPPVPAGRSRPRPQQQRQSRPPHRRGR